MREMNKLIGSPCRNCEERKLGCHSGCKRYLEFKKEVEEIRKQKMKAFDYNDAHFINASRNARRNGKPFGTC